MVHEIGHLFGMKHCVFYLCIMNGCNNFEEFDSKPLYMCPVCIRKLQSNLQFNFLENYQELSKVCAEIGGDIGTFSKFYADIADAVSKAYGPFYK